MIATNASSVLWVFFMYVSTCGRMSEAVAVAAWDGAQLTGPAVFALPKETQRCLFDFLARFSAV